MSKTELSKSIRIGLFVSVGLIALALSILELGGQNFLTRTSYFYVEFNQAQGLAEGSVVSMAGLPIGNVESITIAEKRNVVVAKVSVQSQYLSRITNESELDVRTQGALGDKYIYVSPALSGEPIAEGSTLISSPKPDFLDMISSQTNQVGTSAADLLKELNVLLKEMNTNQRMSRLMENLAATTQNVNRITSDKEFREAVVALSSVLKKIDNGEGTLGALVNDPTLHNRILSFFGDSPRNKYLKPLIREAIRDNDSAELK